MADTPVTAEDEVKERVAYKSPYEQWKEVGRLADLSRLVRSRISMSLSLVPGSRAATGLAAFLNLEGTGGFNDSYVAEIPPGKSLKAHRHLFEETIYILKGQGATSVWIDPNRKETFEWQEGSYFSIPMNAWHEHHNASGLDSARYIAMTSAPRVIDTFNNYEFVFRKPVPVFSDRYNCGGRLLQTKSAGAAMVDQLRRRRARVPNLLRRLRPRRRRQEHGVSHGQPDGQVACLALGRRRLQESAPPRSRHSCLDHPRHRLLDHVAGWKIRRSGSSGDRAACSCRRKCGFTSISTAAPSRFFFSPSAGAATSRKRAARRTSIRA